jgi:hypothetical protein
LFDALRANDSQQFATVLADLERRRLSQDSDWIGDDCMVVLLLLCVRKFNVGSSFLDRLLQARGKTAHLQVQRVNHAFDAIRRCEFAMEGEFAFIKCVYRTLSENWVPSEDDCVKLYKQLTIPGFGEQLDPFMRLLAIRAFDLVIENRSLSLETGNWNRVLQKLQDDGAKLSFIQFLKLLKHLNVGVVLTILLSLATVFGAGRTWSWWASKPALPKGATMSSGPIAIHTKLADASNGWMTPFLRYLEGNGTPSTNLTSISLVAEGDPFAEAMKGFTATGSLPSATKISALGFLMHPVDGLTSSIPIEVSATGNRFTAAVPPCGAGDQLRFLVHVFGQTNTSATSFAAALKLSVDP